MLYGLLETDCWLSYLPVWAQYLSGDIYYKIGMKYLVWESRQCEGPELKKSGRWRKGVGIWHPTVWARAGVLAYWVTAANQMKLSPPMLQVSPHGKLPWFTWTEKGNPPKQTLFDNRSHLSSGGPSVELTRGRCLFNRTCCLWYLLYWMPNEVRYHPNQVCHLVKPIFSYSALEIDLPIFLGRFFPVSKWIPESHACGQPVPSLVLLVVFFGRINNFIDLRPRKTNFLALTVLGVLQKGRFAAKLLSYQSFHGGRQL